MRFLIALAMICLLVGTAFAADQPAPTKVAVDFQDVDAAEALVTLAQKAQVTILGDASVKGKVNCNFIQEVPVDQVLDTVCKPINLEWSKVLISVPPNEKPSAAKVFALLDALKALGSTSVLCQNPATKDQTLFVPKAQPDVLDLSPVADSLKLKAVYVVRAVPKPVDRTAPPQTGPLGQPSPEVTAAANQVWNFFSQMPSDQQFQVMRELGSMIRNNMSPEQQQQMRERWMRDRQDGGDRGNWRGRDGQREGQQGPPQQ